MKKAWVKASLSIIATCTSAVKYLGYTLLLLPQRTMKPLIKDYHN